LLKRILWASCLALNLSAGSAAGLDSAEVDGFVAEMAKEHAFEPGALRGLLGRANRLDSVLAAISKPAEYKPWHAYRPIFITDQRIQGGTRFWASHADALASASLQSGVPPEIIVSIIGVETAYGHHAGNYKVLDSLATLAFHYPPRAPFFRGELRNFLLLAREEGVDPTTLKGSYAGAWGFRNSCRAASAPMRWILTGTESGISGRRRVTPSAALPTTSRCTVGRLANPSPIARLNPPEMPQRSVRPWN